MTAAVDDQLHRLSPVLARPVGLPLEGHAVVVWRNPNAEKKVGIRLYAPPESPGAPWKSHVIDDNTMAFEDLKAADLDGEGRPDIVASGRSTHNLVVYWNRTRMKK